MFNLPLNEQLFCIGHEESGTFIQRVERYHSPDGWKFWGALTSNPRFAFTGAKEEALSLLERTKFCAFCSDGQVILNPKWLKVREFKISFELV